MGPETAPVAQQIRRAVLAAMEAVAPGADVQRIRPGQPLRAQLELDSLDWLNGVETLGERLSVPIRKKSWTG